MYDAKLKIQMYSKKFSKINLNQFFKYTYFWHRINKK